MKTSNSRAKCLALDAESKRLYASTNEGLILVLNVSLMGNDACILIIHSIDIGKNLYAS
jgi:hypothetical protein